MSTPGPIALVGSGEYLETMADVEASLIKGRPPRYVQIATAAVPDGDDVVERWQRLGREQAERLGVEQVVVDVRSQTEADSPMNAALIDGAGLIYLSGGHPGFLADTLRDTALWAAIVKAWQEGAALAGCSAGAMVLSSWVPSIRRLGAPATQGLGLLPNVRVIPHFDRFVARSPELASEFVRDSDGAVTLIGVDERTAIVGGPTEWTVEGHQSAWVLGGGSRTQYRVGDVVRTP